MGNCTFWVLYNCLHYHILWVHNWCHLSWYEGVNGDVSEVLKVVQERAREIVAASELEYNLNCNYVHASYTYSGHI